MLREATPSLHRCRVTAHPMALCTGKHVQTVEAAHSGGAASDRPLRPPGQACAPVAATTSSPPPRPHLHWHNAGYLLQNGFLRGLQSFQFSPYPSAGPLRHDEQRLSRTGADPYATAVRQQCGPAAKARTATDYRYSLRALSGLLSRLRTFPFENEGLPSCCLLLRPPPRRPVSLVVEWRWGRRGTGDGQQSQAVLAWASPQVQLQSSQLFRCRVLLLQDPVGGMAVPSPCRVALRRATSILPSCACLWADTLA